MNHEDDVSSESPLGEAGGGSRLPDIDLRLTPWRQGNLTLLVTLLVTSLVVGVLLLQVRHRVRIVELGYEMTELTRDRRQLLEERERLRIEAAISTRTERLDKVARESLGLEPFRPDQIIKVKK